MTLRNVKVWITIRLNERLWICFILLRGTCHVIFCSSFKRIARFFTCYSVMCDRSKAAHRDVFIEVCACIVVVRAIE